MIESIHLTGIATYGSTPSVLNGLLKFNYVYGANGSGKTTISRVIADSAQFPSCSIVWKARTPLEPLVYNRDFVDKHFRASVELPGIFTLGEKDATAADKIAAAKVECDRIAQEIVSLRKTLEGQNGADGKVGELAIAEKAFKDACWRQKQKHDDKLKVAFEGCRNNAEAFKAKVIAERTTNKSDNKTLDYILVKAETVFADGVEKIEPLTAINGASILQAEKSPILSKKILGKSDVDIAAMLQRLGNSDWVRQGRVFLAANEDTCPFCQQKIASGFEKSLAAYFDESFEADSKAVASVQSKYAADVVALSTALDTLLANPPELLDSTSLVAKKKLFDAHATLNQQRLLEKKKEPSRVIELNASDDLIAEIAAIVDAANKAIAAHNTTVANMTKERQMLKSQVWKFLIEEPLRDAIETYDRKKSQLVSAITNLRTQITLKESARREKEDEIRTLERDVTSIQPTIDAINGLLGSFGFHGFTLGQAQNNRCYRLCRPDGSDAKDTLSEGERTFVTFLYFYHLLKGSATESGATNDRVVVFDDPVSSLDSDILFIVSTLIRKLCDDVRSGRSTIKQVFLLTHNVYFHKEVTFQKSRANGTLKDETFWTVRKTIEQSEISKHTSNPIKSSYELLWLDVKEGRSGNLSIQNSLRRILETYFKMLGGIDLDKIHDRLAGNEKLACRALLSWVNDGSHSAHDDLYIAVDESTVALYLEVFKKIFQAEGHIEHYNMMMAGPSGAGPAHTKL
jgi:wobble nucleotide-excising tRNase